MYFICTSLIHVHCERANYHSVMWFLKGHFGILFFVSVSTPSHLMTPMYSIPGNPILLSGSLWIVESPPKYKRWPLVTLSMQCDNIVLITRHEQNGVYWSFFCVWGGDNQSSLAPILSVEERSNQEPET